MEFLQKTFKLSHAHIFDLDRKDSYHVIILDKFSAIKASNIIREANSDVGHVASVKNDRGNEWLWRCAKKSDAKVLQ